jgi:hypothetical protein
MSNSLNTVPLPDLSYLREMTGGDEAFIKEIITIFLDEVPGMLVSMKENANSGNHDKLKFVTHKLITQLTYVGILSAISDVKIINKESKDLKDLNERVDKVINIVNNSIDNLKKMI